MGKAKDEEMSESWDDLGGNEGGSDLRDDREDIEPPREWERECGCCRDELGWGTVSPPPSLKDVILFLAAASSRTVSKVLAKSMSD
jgi:hypothetical protein